jgi:hypothetical protein
MRRGLAVVVLAAVIGLPGALASTAAAAQTCTTSGFWYAPYVGTGITVPSGITCDIVGTTVGGAITVQPGGRLHLGDHANIQGGITSTNAGTDTTSDPLGQGHFDFSAVICNSFIGGTVNFTGSASNVVIGDDEGCGGNRISGAANLKNNTGGVELIGNAPNDANQPYICPIGKCGISGTVVITGNSGSTHDDSGIAVEVFYNKIAGSLNCSGNSGITNDSSPAFVSDAKTGQCATF